MPHPQSQLIISLDAEIEDYQLEQPTRNEWHEGAKNCSLNDLKMLAQNVRADTHGLGDIRGFQETTEKSIGQKAPL